MKGVLVLILAVVTIVTALPENSEYLKAYVRGYEDAKEELMDERKTYHNEDMTYESDAQRGTVGAPDRDCSGTKFNKKCSRCRNYLDSCCIDSNCNGNRKCKRGIWTYSCDN